MNRLAHLVALAAAAQRSSRISDRPGREYSSSARSWFRIDNAAGDVTPIYLYEEIGVWGVTAGDFVNQLQQVTTKAIDLHINSPGGSVFDGIAIHAALVNHPATVTTITDGLAASAASFVAQAGDVRAIERNASMMIHDASGLVLGNAADMRQMADLLDQMSDVIAGIYADRAGSGTTTSWRDSMRAESWYTGAQAVDAGLADKTLNDTTPAEPTDRRSQLIRARARVTLGRVK